MAVLPLLQVPPEVVSVKVMVLPTQTVEGPVMVPAPVPGVTVMVVLVAAVPQLLVTT
jgi:hypothetical protein